MAARPNAVSAPVNPDSQEVENPYLAVVNRHVPRRENSRRRSPGWWIWVSMLAGVFYFACFCVLTWPLITLFSTHFFMDDGDGMVFVWNAWWVSKALESPELSPWFTPYLHHPHGISLAGHTLSPFNSFLAAALLNWMSLTQAMNALVVLTFVAGGITAFWLCFSVSRSGFGSLAGGFVFAFSSYHFAHAQGHLNLTSIQWIPLYLLLWMRLLRRPSVATGVGAGLALFLVTLCDLYYVMFCVLASAVTLWCYWRPLRRRLRYGQWVSIAPFAALAATAFVTSGIPAGWMLLAAVRDPFAGPGHLPDDHSADLLSLFVPGELSAWASLTQGFWSRLDLVGAEASVYLGLTTLGLTRVAASRYGKSNRARPWIACLCVFGALSLGPILHFAGTEIRAPVLPGLILAALYRFRGVMAIPQGGRVIGALAAYLVLSAWPTWLMPWRIDRDLALLLLAGILAVYLVSMAQDRRQRFSTTLLALLSLAILLADPALTQRALVWAVAFGVLACLVSARRHGVLDSRAAWCWAGAMGYFLLIGIANDIPKLSLSLGALPYGLVEAVLPIIKLGGTPVRFIVIGSIAAAVLTSCALGRLVRDGGWTRIGACLCFSGLALDLWPGRMPATALPAPGFVSVLNQLRNSSAVLDLAHAPGRQLYYQTLYDRPMAFGYTSRIPRSVSKRERVLKRLVTDRQYSRLYRAYGIRYLIVKPGAPTDRERNRIRLLYQDDERALYDLAE